MLFSKTIFIVSNEAFWITILALYIVNPCSAGTVFRRQNLTSRESDVYRIKIKIFLVVVDP